MLHHSHIWFQL